MPFYDELADMVVDLLSPDDAGGLGQGAITIVRETPGVPSPSQPQVPVGPKVLTEDVNHVGEPKAEYRAGETVVTSDYAFMIVPATKFTVAVGDRVRIDGKDIGTIVHVERLGSLSVPVYFEIYVNR